MIRLSKVSRRYGLGDRAVYAVRDVSLEVAEGTFTAIVGPSGSGKSTLLNLIAALDSPSSGTVEVAGRHLGALDDRDRTLFRRDQIGFVFQFFNLLPTLTAAENVALPAKLAGKAQGEIDDRVTTLLAEVGLTDRRDHRPDQLSGGEMQRVAVARALVMNPPLLVADEPTGNLDSKTGRAILELLRGMVGDERTVVLVTHDPKIAAEADRVIEVRDGCIVHSEAA